MSGKIQGSLSSSHGISSKVHDLINTFNISTLNNINNTTPVRIVYNSHYNVNMESYKFNHNDSDNTDNNGNNIIRNFKGHKCSICSLIFVLPQDLKRHKEIRHFNNEHQDTQEMTNTFK